MSPYTDPAERELLLQVFLTEAEEKLAALEDALLGMENRPADDETLHRVFRAAHTVKGGAAMVGLDPVAAFAHALEDVLERVRDRSLAITPQLVTLTLEAVDALRGMTAVVASGGVPAVDSHADLRRRLRQVALSEPAGAAVEDGPPAEPDAGGARELEERRLAGRRSLRVDVETLDRLLALVGEIAVARAGQSRQLADLTGGAAKALRQAHHDADRLYLELHELVMRMRLVPVGATFRQFARSLRDAAAAAGKDVELVLEGERVEVDTAIVERLRDSLTHLVRNAVDHGIETPEARVAAGKPRKGVVTLCARQEGGSVVVEVADDGAGFRRDRIAQRARERGVADPEHLAPQDLHRLVFEPGFSTAERVSDLSGRGVGMDVVRRSIEALRGTVGVESREGVGTTILMRVPLTLAIIDGFVVGVGEDTYILPLESVDECLPLAADAEGRPSEGVMDVRGQALPCVRLRDHFGLGGAPRRRESVVVVSHRGARAGLIVDELLGESQTVIKPLGTLFQGTRAVAGSAILGTGRVGLILDVAAVLEELTITR